MHRLVAWYCTNVFLKKLEDISPFLWATDTPFLDFWWCLLWVSNPEWEWGLIHTWQRYTCCMFPEIHHWCYTCWPLCGQHGHQADVFHINAIRHWWDSNGRTITQQVYALPTELCVPMFVLTIQPPSVAGFAFWIDIMMKYKNQVSRIYP